MHYIVLAWLKYIHCTIEFVDNHATLHENGFAFLDTQCHVMCFKFQNGNNILKSCLLNFEIAHERTITGQKCLFTLHATSSFADKNLMKQKLKLLQEFIYSHILLSIKINMINC